jgi:hypothetical protein
LSAPTRARVQALFQGAARGEAERLLEEKCADNLPFCQGSIPKSIEGVHFAALRWTPGVADD